MTGTRQSESTQSERPQSTAGVRTKVASADEAPASGAMHESGAGKVAVLVFHGMGQQLPFAELEGIAAALLAHGPGPVGEEPLKVRAVRLQPRRGPEPAPKPGTASPAATRPLQRVEMNVSRKNLAGETKRAVHLYEVYWAPLTEGRATALDVAWFLVEAGCRGIARSATNALFGLGGRTERAQGEENAARVDERLLFGKWRPVTSDPWTFLAFLVALIVFISLVVINATIAAVAAARFLSVSSPGLVAGWPSDALFGRLTFYIGAFDAVALLAGAALFILKSSRAHHKPSWPATWLGWIVVALAIGAAVVAAFLSGVAVVRDTGCCSFILGLPTADELRAGPPGWLLTAAVWVLAIVITTVARWFFVQYLGDVAAYVSAHSLNKFWELRENIRATASGVARAVYGAWEGNEADTPHVPSTDGDGAERGHFVYESVVVVGHSLGSVVAYDTLNRLLNEDFICEQAAPAGPLQPGSLAPGSLGVAGRTPLLLTSGSPLNKLVFVFRNNRAREARVQETLAASTQPMIVDYRHRPRRWVNLWSPNDIISGKLTYFDKTESADEDESGKFVCNIKDVGATTPLFAHIEYVDGAYFSRILHDAVLGEEPSALPCDPPAKVPRPQ